MILRKNIDLSEINPRNLTNDCKFVLRIDESIDIVKEYSSVRVFDFYWDQGIRIKKIWHTGGTRNPKFQQPEF